MTQRTADQVGRLLDVMHSASRTDLRRNDEVGQSHLANEVVGRRRVENQHEPRAEFLVARQFT